VDLPEGVCGEIEMHYRNLSILFTCQLIAVSGSVVLITLGGIIGTRLAPDPAWATLPLSIMVLGTAISTVLAALLMRRVGRRAGFMCGAALAITAGLVAAYALHIESFVLFCVGVGCYGVNVAFVQQYRFAAAESVASAAVPKAVSTVLLGAIGGAFVGPYIASHSGMWAPQEPFVGAMLAIAALQGCAFFLLVALAPARVEPHDPAVPAGARSLRDIVAQPLFVIAVAGGMVAWGIMTLIMTATPLSMHVGHGFSLEDTGWVIRSHVMAMYLPSLVSGWLISRFGARRIMEAGIAAMAATVISGLQGQALMHYWLALVMLGIGWNFLYIGGTSLLVETYRPAERFKAQAVNEFGVFGVSAIGSMLAGAIVYRFDWDVLMWAPVPLLLAMAGGLAWMRLRGRVAARVSA
jgi:MFS family permease